MTWVEAAIRERRPVTAARMAGGRWDRPLLLLMTAALVAGLGLTVIQGMPIPGSADQGQWLMTTRYYLHEPLPGYREVSALPPLIPASLALVRGIVGDPILTLRIFNLMLLMGISAGFAFLGFNLFRTREAAFASVLVPLLLSDRFQELLAFGGLLQAGAITFSLFSYASFVRAGQDPSRSSRWWWAGSVSLGLIGLAHVGTATIAIPIGVGIALLSFLRRRQRDRATSLTILAPLVVVLLPLAIYWLAVVLPSNREFVTNPASLNYRGPGLVVSDLTRYWPNADIVALGSLSIAWGALRDLRRRIFGPYLILALWAAAAWGSFLFAALAGAGTDYPRFVYLILPPVAIGAAGFLGWLSGWLARRLRLAAKTRPDAALGLLAALTITVAPVAVDHFISQYRFYGVPDGESLLRTVGRLDAALSGREVSVVTPVKAGMWVEALSGRPALFNQRVSYQFRPGEWQRSVDADVLQNATAALTNEFFLVEYSGRAGSGPAEAPVDLVIAANHGGEFVDLMTLAHKDTSIGPQPGGISLASLSAKKATTTHDDTEAAIRTEWQGSESSSAVRVARTVRLARADPTLSLTDETSSGTTSVLYPAPGIAFSSIEVSANEAHVCFSRRGNSVPCLSLAVRGADALIERSEGGGLLVRGGAGGLELQITDLTAGGAFVGLGLLDPRELVTKYDVGAAILDAYDRSYDETTGRLGALGFRVSFVDGTYALLLRDAPVSERLTP
jgi:hypothetical protein